MMPHTLGGIRTRAYLLVALYALLAAGSLNQTRPYHGDESFYVVSSIGMLQSGNGLLPVYFGEPRLQKPILPYWIAAAGHATFGVTLWSGRVGFLLLACGLLLLVYKLAFLLAGDHDYALLSMVLLSSATLFVELSRVSMPDVPLTFFSTLALYFFCKSFEACDAPLRWQGLAFASMGLAFASKGLLAIAPGLAAAAVAVIGARRPWAALFRLGRPVNLLLFAVPAFAWHAYIYARYPAELISQFRSESTANLFPGFLQSLGHLAFYAGAILAYFLPFAAVAVCLAVRRGGALPRAFLPVIAHVAAGLLILVAVVRMHYPRYLLVVLPQVALLAAFVLHRARLRRPAQTVALVWAGLQLAFFLCYPFVAGDPLKTLVSRWEEQLHGDLAAYELSSRERGWVLALSHGQLKDYREDERPYVILDERGLGDFHDYEIVMEDARLRSVRLDSFSLVGTYRRYYLIRPGPPR